MSVSFTPEAAEELAAYLDRIDGDNPQAALQEEERLWQALKLLQEFPSLGREQRIRGVRGEVRCFPIPPLLLFYVLVDGGLEVLHVWHGARSPLHQPR